MSTVTTLPGPTRWLLPLLLGAVLCAGLWAVGLPEMGWVGFLAAAFLGPALHRGAVTHAEEPGTAVPHAMTAGARPPVGDLAVDAAGSRVHVAVRKWGWPVHGQLTVAAGRARVTDDPGGCRVTVSAAAASFTTGNHARDRHVRGPAFLDAARWPDLTFASTQVSRRPDGTWDVAGTLTVRGVAAPARFVVDDWWVGDDDRVVASARGTLSRSALGVGHLRWLVGDRVRVSARLLLVPCR